MLFLKFVSNFGVEIFLVLFWEYSYDSYQLCVSDFFHLKIPSIVFFTKINYHIFFLIFLHIYNQLAELDFVRTQDVSIQIHRAWIMTAHTAAWGEHRAQLFAFSFYYVFAAATPAMSLECVGCCHQHSETPAESKSLNL